MRPFLAFILGFAFAARAENQPQPGAPQPQNQGPRSSAVQVWDDRVFDLEPKSPPPTTRKSANGTERYLGADPDYNQGQREQAMEVCAGLKNTDLRAYRKCFADEIGKGRDSVRRNQAEIEGRTSLPLRNVPAPLYDSENQRNPAYDVQVERAEE